MIPTVHRRSTRAALAMAVAATATLTAIASGAPPTSAGTVSTVITSSSPITWVDSQDRQLMVATSSNTTLTIARDTPTGEPDTTWGPNGTKTVTFALPSGATWTSIHIAAADDGVLTLVHGSASCTGSEPCDRWFQQIDGTTGATVSGPVAVEEAPPTWRALDDGSVLLGAAGTPLAWHGPDGAERALVPLTTDQITDVDVDAAGRLLVLADDGSVARYAAGEAADLDIETGCDPAEHASAIGASAMAPGFAVACMPDDEESGGAAVERYGDDGALTWSSPASASGAPTGYLNDLTVTQDGRVWVGTRGFSLFLFGFPAQPVVVTPVSADGWAPRAYERSAGTSQYTDFGGGIAQLRPVGDGNEVAVADLRVCCRYPNNTSGAMAAHSAIIPSRPGPPIGTPGPLTMGTTAGGDLTVRFDGATWVPAKDNRRATSYRVDATVDGVTTTATAPETGSGAPTSATVPGIGLGDLVHVTVTPVNAEGDGPGVRTGSTITPFEDVDDFVDHQARTLGGRPLPAGVQASAVGSVTAGNLSPGAFMEEIITSGGAPRESVEPTARIYRAAFLRDADIGGLRYWYAKHRGGTRIVAIAEQFARSSEFTRRYGTLTNRQFVARIYQNVLGRAGDAAGIAFWTGRLDSGRATRGTVLAGFSESGEFVRKTNGAVQTLIVTFLMLDRRPTAAERATWETAEAPYADFPEAVLATPEYAARIRNR